MASFLLSGFSDEIDKDLSVQMRELKRIGITHIEMRFVNGKSIIDYSIPEAKEIKKQLDDQGISLSAIGSPLGKIRITDPFEQHLDQFKHTLELADVLNTSHIRLFSFYIPEGEKPENYRDEVLERWHAFVMAAKDTGIVLAHENEKGIYGDTAERCLELVEAMNVQYVRVVFDPANFVQCNVKTYPEAYHMLKPHIEYMHIKDALAGSGKVVPAGYGDGRLYDILSDIDKTMDKEMVLSLEPHLGAFSGFAELEKTSDMGLMEESNAGKFEYATRALKNILSKMGHQF